MRTRKTVASYAMLALSILPCIGCGGPNYVGAFSADVDGRRADMDVREDRLDFVLPFDTSGGGDAKDWLLECRASFQPQSSASRFEVQTVCGNHKIGSRDGYDAPGEIFVFDGSHWTGPRNAVTTIVWAPAAVRAN